MVGLVARSLRLRGGCRKCRESRGRDRRGVCQDGRALRKGSTSWGGRIASLPLGRHRSSLMFPSLKGNPLQGAVLFLGARMNGSIVEIPLDLKTRRE